jgi:hypothetical protein
MPTLALAGCLIVGDSPSSAGREPTASADASADQADGERITSLALQAEMFAFADRYIEAIAEGSDWSAVNASDGLLSDFYVVKAICATSAISVATLASPPTAC